MHRIFEKIRSGDFPNHRKLADELAVGQKTIQRDIEFMKDFMELPIEYNPTRYGFYFSSPVDNFPLLKLTEGELFAIFVGEKALESYIGTPFEQPLKNTFKKFAAGLSGELSFQWSELQNAISFKSMGTHPINPHLLQELVLAIRKRREITFDYRGLTDERFQRRRVQPYELGSVDHKWYLFAFDHKRNAIRTFVPARMQALQTSNVTFPKPRDFSANKHLQNSFGVFAGGNPVTIRILFDQFAAQLIRERQWHPSQQMLNRDDGRLELVLSLGSFEEIERWILSWGLRAQVLDPPELVTRLKTIMTKCLAQY